MFLEGLQKYLGVGGEGGAGRVIKVRYGGFEIQYSARGTFSLLKECLSRHF